MLMNKTEMPVLEDERIESLKKYNILDTPPDGSFDRITALAAKLLNVPIAIVTLVDTDRIWFKSRYGLDVQQIGRDPGLCASAILGDELYLVEDAAKDPRTLSNPLVASSFGLRFYAAVPLKVRDGHNLGTLCVIDKQPRTLSADDKIMLEYLADILIDQMELRLEARTAMFRQNQLLNIAAHDLKNPLTTISLWAELASQMKDNPQQVEEVCTKIKDAGAKMRAVVNDLLEAAKAQANDIRFKNAPINMAALVEKVISTNTILANNKGINLNLIIKDRPVIIGDETKFMEIVDNLVSNALKFSQRETTVTVTVSMDEENALFEVADEGPGFSHEDHAKLFQRFVTLSAKPTGGETSTGLGLSIVKTLVEAHKGKISANSFGLGKGASFLVEIPVSSN